MLRVNNSNNNDDDGNYYYPTCKPHKHVLGGALPTRLQWRGGHGTRRAGASGGYPEPRETARPELFPLRLHGPLQPVGDIRNKGGSVTLE